MISIGNLIHRTVVFSTIGFGVYGLAVITQNFMVKRQRLREYDEAHKAAASDPSIVLPPPPPPIVNTKPLQP